jgi:hypothetical protein
VGEEPDRWLVIGHDRVANRLEVIVLITATGAEVIPHAMPLRTVYRKLPDQMTKRTHRHTKSAKLIDSTASRGWPTKPTLATTSTRSSPAAASAAAPGSLCSRPSPEIRGTMTEEELVAERPGSARAFQGRPPRARQQSNTDQQISFRDR